MSPVDALAIIVLCVGGLWGFLQGAVRQVTSFFGWAAAIALPYFFAGSVGRVISVEFDAPYPIAFVVASILLGLLGQILVRIVLYVVRRIVRRIAFRLKTVGKDQEERDEEKEERFQGGLSDSVLGGLIGGGKWAAIIWVLLSAAALIVRPLQQHGHHLGIEDSEAYRLADQHNALALIWKDDFRRLRAAIQRIQSAKRVTDAKTQSAAEMLSKDERIRKVLADERLKKALQTGDIRTLMESPELLSLVTDPSIMENAFTVAGASMNSVASGTE